VILTRLTTGLSFKNIEGLKMEMTLHQSLELRKLEAVLPGLSRADLETEFIALSKLFFQQQNLTKRIIADSILPAGMR
jgi:hypothetical protein